MTLTRMRVFVKVVGLLAVGLLCLLLIGRVLTLRDQENAKPFVTYKRLLFLASGCDTYRSERGRWPESLSQLRGFNPNFGEWDKDMWGREFVLVPYSEVTGYGKLISYGRDGEPGGANKDRDLEIRFPTDANTVWNEQVGADLDEPRFRQ